MDLESSEEPCHRHPKMSSSDNLSKYYSSMRGIETGRSVEEGRDAQIQSGYSSHEKSDHGHDSNKSNLNDRDIEAEKSTQEDWDAVIQPKSSRTTAQRTRLVDEIMILLCILTGSILGVLARKGLTNLTTYLGSYLGGIIWCNFSASLIMGASIFIPDIWQELIGSKLFESPSVIPLYVGIGTGFCGSFSSFSTLILEAFYKAADLEPKQRSYYPNQAYGIMEFLAVVLAHICISISAFLIGKDIASEIKKYLKPFSTRVYILLEGVWVLIGLAAYIVVIVLCGVKKHGSWRSWTFSCIFGVFGAYLRYLLSRYFNSAHRYFFFGTYMANFLGTLLLSILILLQRGTKPENTLTRLVNDKLSCQVLEGLADGFCGCLTTVSTFVAELMNLKSYEPYVYGLVSLLTSFAALVLTLGTYAWKVSLTTPVC